MDAATASVCGPTIHGIVFTRGGPIAGGQHEGAALGQRSEVVDLEDRHPEGDQYGMGSRSVASAGSRFDQ